MNLKQIINKSVYGTIGYVSSQDDLDLLEHYILNNLKVLKEFKQILIATNYKTYPELVKENTDLWKKYFPNCITLDSEFNRKSQIGTSDLDNSIFNYCKINNIEWLCKASNDVILHEFLLDKEIEKSDFYYTNGIGYGRMLDWDFDYERIIKDTFYPQTNFYIINVSKCDYLVDLKKLEPLWEKYKNNISNLRGYNCENNLMECVERNKLHKYNLVPQNKFIMLLDIIKNHQLHDPSHKNILIEGICHLQYPNQPVIII